MTKGVARDFVASGVDPSDLSRVVVGSGTGKPSRSNHRETSRNVVVAV